MSVCRIQSSELGLLFELESCCWFSALDSGCRGAAGPVTGVDSRTFDASACCIQRSELGLILELGWQT
eukprot:7273898-Pyramimonas_sp.AAC.1